MTHGDIVRIAKHLMEVHEISFEGSCHEPTTEVYLLSQACLQLLEEGDGLARPISQLPGVWNTPGVLFDSIRAALGRWGTTTKEEAT